MPTLIYKRTHPGDPDETGWFGIHDCMGQVRRWPFDAVIGVGGTGAEPKRHGLNRKVNWIGIGPRKREAAGKRGPDVTFDHFRFFGPSGPSFDDLAPRLAARLYADKKHFLLGDFGAVEQREVHAILALAKKARPSSADRASRLTPSKQRAPRTPSAKSIRGCSC